MSEEQNWQAKLTRQKTLDALVTMETFCARLRPVLADPSYRKRTRFDWPRFVREHFPEVTPPPEVLDVFRRLERTTGGELPMRWIWWVVKVQVGAVDPDIWLQEQRAAGVTMGEIGARLGHGITAAQLYQYIYRSRQRAGADKD